MSVNPVKIFMCIVHNPRKRAQPIPPGAGPEVGGGPAMEKAFVLVSVAEDHCKEQRTCSVKPINISGA